MTRRYIPASAAFAAGLLALLAGAAPLSPDLLSGLTWRNIGPFRGGRISAASGVVGDVGTFYVGLPEGGVWKTTSGGSTWYPVFDSVPNVSGIGAVAVAPSNGGVIYAGTGDLYTFTLYDPAGGMYRSADSGKTWSHLGLDSAREIAAIFVDPRDANVVLAATLGLAREKTDVRGVFRSTDGGAHWTRTLAISDSTGVMSLTAAYDRPDVIFATSMITYAAPAPAAAASAPKMGTMAPTGAGIFKSVDGGRTWKELIGTSVPRFAGRTRMAVAQGTNAQRVYLVSNTGLYRSDDGGTTWRQMAADDKRIRNGQGGYNCGVFVDPRDPDVVYAFNITAYKSVDGGKTFTGFKGAPGGDDPQAGWIDPTNGRRILLGYDQGAIVSYDGGTTWSSWYNQSTEQVYHIAADHSFPPWIYATQQDAGAIRIHARGDLGAITPLDWSPVNGWEWGTILPDPLDESTVYSSGNGINRISMRSGQWISVSPASDPTLHLRAGLDAPIAFAPWDPHELLAGFQFVMATTDRGAHWSKLSPDLTYPAGVTPPPDTATPAPNAPPPSAISSLSPSPVAKGLIWIGTGNGLIKLTRDHGKHWSDVSIPDAPPRTRNIHLAASPFHEGTAYATFFPPPATEYRPSLYRTRDFGAHWALITNGLAAGALPSTVFADPVRDGLLYLGTITGIYVSFDDGDDWQPLQRGLPIADAQAFTFAGNDLVVGTYGRGMWVMDGASVLRQMTSEVAREPVRLFQPDTAVRVRRNVNYNTPFPPEVPQALNPPEGAIIYYWLASKPSAEITLDVLDSTGAAIRHLSSIPAPPVKEAGRPPLAKYWIAPPEALPSAAGTNRANWDLKLEAPLAFFHAFEINANPGRTPPSPEAPLAPAGRYTLRLTVDGKSYTRPLVVVNDPRSPAKPNEVAAQVALHQRMMAAMRAAWEGFHQVAAMSAALDSAQPSDTTSAAWKAIAGFRARLDSIGGDSSEEGSDYVLTEPDMPPANFHGLNEWLGDQLIAQASGDLAPNEAMLNGYAAACRSLTSVVARWQGVNAKDVPALNAELAKAGLRAIPSAAGVTAPKC